MIHTGSPTRFELWSCAVIVIGVFVALSGINQSNDVLNAQVQQKQQQQIEIALRQLDCLIVIEAKLGKMATTSTNSVGREPSLNDLTREILKKQGNIE